METLIAELCKQEGAYKTGYDCEVYRIDRIDIPNWPELGPDEFVVLENGE